MFSLWVELILLGTACLLPFASRYMHTSLLQIQEKKRNNWSDWYWLSQNGYWLFLFQASKCEPTLITEPKGDKEEGKSYYWVNWLIFHMGEASLKPDNWKQLWQVRTKLRSLTIENKIIIFNLAKKVIFLGSWLIKKPSERWRKEYWDFPRTIEGGNKNYITLRAYYFECMYRILIFL